MKEKYFIRQTKTKGICHQQTGTARNVTSSLERKTNDIGQKLRCTLRNEETGKCINEHKIILLFFWYLTDLIDNLLFKVLIARIYWVITEWL